MDERSDTTASRQPTRLPHEDAWAYTPRHRDLLARAHRDSRKGRVRQLTEADLARLGEQAR